eukprot:bmy_13694T0
MDSEEEVSREQGSARARCGQWRGQRLSGVCNQTTGSFQIYTWYHSKAFGMGQEEDTKYCFKYFVYLYSFGFLLSGVLCASLSLFLVVCQLSLCRLPQAVLVLWRSRSVCVHRLLFLHVDEGAAPPAPAAERGARAHWEVLCVRRRPLPPWRRCVAWPLAPQPLEGEVSIGLEYPVLLKYFISRSYYLMYYASDGPAEVPVTNGNTATGQALNDDLDIFGPMISNPLPATVLPPAQGTSSVPAAAALSTVTSGDLDLFTEQATKSEEVAKKQLSRDSILSLYGTGAIQQHSAPGVFMGPTNIPFPSQAPAAFQGFPSMGGPVPAAPGLAGSVMGPSAGVMVGVPLPNGFMGNAQTGVMPLPQSVVGPPGGMVGHVGAAQSKFGLPPAQQPPWNLSQVNQQMAGLSLGSASPAAGFSQPPSTTAGAAGWSGGSSGQTLSTQLWK